MRTRMGWEQALIAGAVMLCGCGGVQAQDTVGAAPKPPTMAKNADPNWAVAAVRPSDPNDPNGQRIRIHGRHVTLLDHTVEDILLIGYHLQKGQIVGEPDWAKTERWNVDGLADVDGEPSLVQLQSLMRKLLTERFGMKLHREQRQMPVFGLRVGKGGPKMTANTSDPNGWLDQQNGSVNGSHLEKLKNISMPELAEILQFHVPRPVVDQTDLKGKWDLQLKWLTDDNHAADPAAPPGLFTAIQEQLGLKLEPVKAMADVLVIDKVERPGAN
jgi:uncharacterized protein (TIGR03435 family)